MFSLLDYGLRLAQYLDLMLLFGLPLFAWYSPAALTVSGDRRSLLPKRALSLGLLICAVLGLALVSIEIARNAAGIMGSRFPIWHGTIWPGICSTFPPVAPA